MSEKRSGRGWGVSRTPVSPFLTLFQHACLVTLFSIMHSAQLMIDSRSRDTAFYGWLKTPKQGKESSVSSAYQHVVLCVLGCTRASLIHSTVLTIPFST